MAWVACVSRVIPASEQHTQELLRHLPVVKGQILDGPASSLGNDNRADVDTGVGTDVVAVGGDLADFFDDDVAGSTDDGVALADFLVDDDAGRFGGATAEARVDRTAAYPPPRDDRTAAYPPPPRDDRTAAYPPPPRDDRTAASPPPPPADDDEITGDQAPTARIFPVPHSRIPTPAIWHQAPERARPDDGAFAVKAPGTATGLAGFPSVLPLPPHTPVHLPLTFARGALDAQDAMPPLLSMADDEVTAPTGAGALVPLADDELVAIAVERPRRAASVVLVVVVVAAAVVAGVWLMTS